MEEKSIDIVELVKLFKSKIWIIIIVTIITTSIGIYKTYDSDVSYDSTAKVYISKGEELVQYYSEEEIEYYSKIVDIFQELSNTNGFFDDVLKKNKIDKTSSEVSAGISIELNENSPIFTVSYRSMSLKQNKETLEAVCTELIERVSTILPEANPVILNEIRVATIYPDKLKTPILAAIFGVILSVGIILVLYYMDNRILSKKQLEKIINIPVLAKLPKYNKKFNDTITNCVVRKDEKPISAEVYKGLRTNINVINKKKEIKSILITSSISNEGKSTVATNLAFTMGMSKEKVVLLNCDLKKGNNEKFGITDYIDNKCKLEEVLNKVTETVYVVNPGRKVDNSSEILDSIEMDKFIEELSLQFDYIIFDSPPALLFADALVLASKVDATILVTREKLTRENVLIEAYEEIKNIGGDIIGCVLNNSTDNLVNKYIKNYKKQYKRQKDLGVIG